MAKKRGHDPDKSKALVVRYWKGDPRKHRIVKKVSGQKEAAELVEKLRGEEKKPDEYDYLWRWENPRAALEADLKQMIRERSE
jgi:hypothetical protein